MNQTSPTHRHRHQGTIINHLAEVNEQPGELNVDVSAYGDAKPFDRQTTSADDESFGGEEA